MDAGDPKTEVGVVGSMTFTYTKGKATKNKIVYKAEGTPADSIYVNKGALPPGAPPASIKVTFEF